MAGRLPASEIHEGVRRIFNRVAEMPTAAFRFGVGAALAREVGYLESVVAGLDMAEAMVAKACQAAALLGVEHASFERGEAEAMPFGDATFDAALVNGIFNLCPDKPPVARELHRVLRAGGRAVVALFEDAGFVTSILARTRNQRAKTPGTYIAIVGLRKPAGRA